MGWETLILRLTVKGQRSVQRRAQNNFLGSAGCVLLTSAAISKPKYFSVALNVQRVPAQCYCWVLNSTRTGTAFMRQKNPLQPCLQSSISIYNMPDEALDPMIVNIFNPLYIRQLATHETY